MRLVHPASSDRIERDKDSHAHQHRGTKPHGVQSARRPSCFAAALPTRFPPIATGRSPLPIKAAASATNPTRIAVGAHGSPVTYSDSSPAAIGAIAIVSIAGPRTSHERPRMTGSTATNSCVTTLKAMNERSHIYVNTTAAAQCHA